MNDKSISSDVAGRDVTGPGSTARHVFTYGSLMFAPVWGHVVRGQYQHVLASLQDFQRFAVSGQTYPAVLRQPGGLVAGRLYFDVGADDMARLDEFEGGDYERVATQVKLASGEDIEAHLYLYRWADRLELRDWDPEWFEADGIRRFTEAFCRPDGI